MTVKLRLLAVVLLPLVAISSFAQNKITVVAHRGDWRNHPENSVNAFKSAVKMGVDMVELDFGKTKDGVLIIMHDKTIDRTTDGKGKPEDYTYEQLKAYHLRNGLGRVTTTPIPTFREVMLALKESKVKVNLDKSYPFYREIYAVLEETGTLEQAVFKSEVSYDSLKANYSDLIGKISYMPVVSLDKPGAKSFIQNYLQHMRPYGFELVFPKDTSDILYHNDFISKTGSRVWMNSLWASLNAGHDDDKAVEEGNTKDSWDWLLEHGATVIQTDRPAELLAYLRKKKLHN